MRLFVFRLARQLGKTVRQLLSEMDSQELSEWLAYDRIEPMDDPYWRSGMTAAVMCTVWGDGKKKHTPQDFMPQQKKKQTAKQMFESFKAAAKGN